MKLERCLITFASHLLFRSALVTVGDSVCRPHCSQCGGEERAATHGLVFRGVAFLFCNSPRVDGSWRNRLACSFSIGSNRIAWLIPLRAVTIARRSASRSMPSPITSAVYDPTVGDGSDGYFPMAAALSSHSLAWGLYRLRASLQTPGSPEPLAVEEACAALLTESVTSARCPSGKRPRRSVTRRAHRELVAANANRAARCWRGKLTLDQLARAVFSSPFHLARVFRRETGLGLHQYQTNLRLRHALERLAEDVTADLTMLALELGFSSHAHFTAAFRRAFQVAPSRSRKKAVACLGRTR